MHPRYLRPLSTSQHPCHPCLEGIPWTAPDGTKQSRPLQVPTEPLPVVVWQRPQPLIPDFPVLK